MADNPPYEYDVCLSFAGEQRPYVEQVAEELIDAGVKVFYDRYEQAGLWGKDLYVHLDTVYREKARFCVLFASQDYARKLWTNHERKSAQARAFRNHAEYILPARFDDTEIPGIPETIGYLDLARLAPSELARLVVQKLRAGPTGVAPPPSPHVRGINQLPPDVRHFTGRAAELAALDSLMVDDEASSSAIVITAIDGTAGVGKTALAVHWAYRASEKFPDGILYVNLRGYDEFPPLDPRSVLTGFLRALDVARDSIPDDLAELSARFRSTVADRKFLVLLDNAADSRQVRPLLPGSPGSLAVITSRRQLTGLRTRDGAGRLVVDPLTKQDAVALVTKIISTARAAGEPEAIVELVGLCSRLPLALRIAAEQVADDPELSIAETNAQLRSEQDRLDILAADDDETASMRVVFSWSFRQLSRAAAALFCKLGVHPGSEFGVDALRILHGDNPGQIAPALTSLLRFHLVERSAPDRYGVHDLLWIYAKEKSADLDTAVRNRTRSRILRWYLESADAADRTIAPRRRHVPLTEGDDLDTPVFVTAEDAVAWCDRELTNLVSATSTAAGAGDDATAWKLPVALFGYFNLRKPWTEWIATHEIGLSAARRAHDRQGEAWTTNGLGVANYDLRRYSEAFAAYDAALETWRSVGDRYGEGATLLNRGAAHWASGDIGAAIADYESTLRIFAEIGERWGEAMLLNNLSAAYRDRGQAAVAADYGIRALEIWRELGEPRGEGMSLNTLGEAFLAMRDYHEALVWFRRALAVRRAIDDRWGQGMTLAALDEVHRGLGDPDAARQALLEAVMILDDLGDPTVAELRTRLADVDAGSG